MFRMLESGLPKEPTFAKDLGGLGYFINEKDEIRNIRNPKAYSHFYITRSSHYNNLLCEAMNTAIRDIVIARLEGLGLELIRLPLGAAPCQPHVPIFVSRNISTKKRVVLLFNEHIQDLGIFAYRIISGAGGINAGSAVNLVKYIYSKYNSPNDAECPGIILANMGQLRWYRRGKRAVTHKTWQSLPQKSAVEPVLNFDPVKNTVPGNRTTKEHVEYVFNHVVQKLCHKTVKLCIIGVGDGATQVSQFLEKEVNLERWGERIEAFASLASLYHPKEIETGKFGLWLARRARAYVVSDKPKGSFLVGPNGSRNMTALGCPVFSLGEPYYIETLLPNGHDVLLDWFEEVAKTDSYFNPQFETFDSVESQVNEDEITVNEW